MRKDDNVGLSSSSTINTLSIKVTERIESKYLTDFILTTIKNSDIQINQKSFYFFTFLKSSLTYEIIVFVDQEKKDFIFEPFLLLGYYYKKRSENSVDLFLLDNFFVLFKNQQFLTFKTIQNAKPDDVKIYLLQTYNIKIDNTIQIDQKESRQIRANYFVHYKDKINYDYGTLYKNNSFKLFQLFVLISTIVFGYFIYEKVNNTKQIKSIRKKDTTLDIAYNRLKNQYKQHNIKVIDKTIELFKYLKLNKITVELFDFNNNQINISLIHKDKKRLLDFLTIYDTVDVKSIEFQKDKSNYKMIAFIKEI
jgi:uncharacterized membrane protein